MKSSNKIIYCHNTNNGTNYGIEIKNNLARLFSYYTNGSSNSDYSYSPYRKLETIKKALGEKAFTHITENSRGGEQIERVLGNWSFLTTN